MPRAALHPCGKPGCRELLPRGKRYCAEHQRAAYKAIDRNRESSHYRGYDSVWRRVRIAKLQENPFCECDECKGKMTPASVVDHIKSVAERPDLRLEFSNLRSMAKRCHDRRTARDQGFARPRGRGESNAGGFS